MLTAPVWESFSAFSLVAAQALPELPEDVLRVYADAVQRTGLAEHHPPHHNQFTARCHQEGSLQGCLSHSHRTCTGRTREFFRWFCSWIRISILVLTKRFTKAINHRLLRALPVLKENRQYILGCNIVIERQLDLLWLPVCGLALPTCFTMNGKMSERSYRFLPPVLFSPFSPFSLHPNGSP